MDRSLFLPVACSTGWAGHVHAGRCGGAGKSLNSEGLVRLASSVGFMDRLPGADAPVLAIKMSVVVLDTLGFKMYD